MDINKLAIYQRESNRIDASIFLTIHILILILDVHYNAYFNVYMRRTQDSNLQTISG